MSVVKHVAEYLISFHDWYFSKPSNRSVFYIILFASSPFVAYLDVLTFGTLTYTMYFTSTFAEIFMFCIGMEFVAQLILIKKMAVMNEKQ